MALSIKTEEADRLARELSSLTGRSLTAVITEALAEKLERERANRPVPSIDWMAVDRLLAEMRRGGCHAGPMTKAEWDDISDEGIDQLLGRSSS